MNRIRYLLGVAVVVSYPPGMLFWFLIHPFARRWRAVGPIPAYLVTFSAMTALGVWLYQARVALLGEDLGTNWYTVGVSSVFFAVVVALRRAYRRHLTRKILVGLPELSRGTPMTSPLREGIYGIVRHPRYLSMIVSGLGYGLIVNYIGIYILVVSAIPALYVITRLEERELVERFGEAYKQYQREVPRFIPRGVRRSAR